MFVVHRSQRTHALVGVLADELATPPVDPLTPLQVAVHSRGVERWLLQELSQRLGVREGRQDGIAANIDFPFPERLVRDILALSGVVSDPVADPWARDRLAWTILDLERRTPDLLPAGTSVTEHPLGAARHAAALLDRCGAHRPAMCAAWLDGHDVGGDGEPLPEHHRWQPRLWRALRDELGTTPPERLAACVDELRSGAVDDQLPERLFLFGLTSVPRLYLDLFRTVAERIDVHLFLQHPSPTLWSRGVGAQPPRPNHPLLRSWGSDTENLRALLGAGPAITDQPVAPNRQQEPATLLHRLQQDMADDVEPPGEPLDGDDARWWLAPDDRSIEVHACHGQIRQVEILRDVILHRLADDPTLEPRDIVVMCPDVETFAPLIDAVFSPADPDNGLPRLRVRLADRALRTVNPCLLVLGDLLGMASGRMGASAVLDLAAREPVRRRFGLDEDDLDRLQEWVRDLGVRWGLDEDHRRDLGIDRGESTWRTGLDRLLLGVAMDDNDELFGSVLPYGNVDGQAIDLAGRLAELVERLGALRRQFLEPTTVTGWHQRLLDATRAFTAAHPDEGWQQLEVGVMLDDVLATADDHPDLEVGLDDIRSLLADRLGGRPTRANHRTGELTVCTLVPMRSVPYRVVCLLGMDDGVFPRRPVPSGDDLVAAHPQLGDRDPRTEDRQLLLDAVLSAGEHLVVVHQGRSELTNQKVPPAVPVLELLDTLDATAVGPDRVGTARDHVQVVHPLRPTSPRVFTPGALVPGRPFGFDQLALAGAEARRDEPVPAPRFLDSLPDPVDAGDTLTIALDDLRRTLREPTKIWARERLGLTFDSVGDAWDDHLPFNLGGLEKWDLGTRFLTATLEDRLDEQVAIEVARGTLPPGALGDATIREVTEVSDEIIALLRANIDAARLAADPDDVEVNVALETEAGRRIRVVGVVPGVRNGVLPTWAYSKISAKSRIDMWTAWLGAAAAGVPIRRFHVGRHPNNSVKANAMAVDLVAGAMDPEEARLELGRLVELVLRIKDQPIPLFPATSWEYAHRTLTGRDLGRVVDTQWRRWGGWGDGDDEWTRLVFGHTELEELYADAATEAESGPGWHETEASRFGRYALRLWEPFLRAERVL